MKASRSPRFHASTEVFHTALTSAAGSPTRACDGAHELMTSSNAADETLIVLRMPSDIVRVALLPCGDRCCRRRPYKFAHQAPAGIRIVAPRQVANPHHFETCIRHQRRGAATSINGAE